MNEIKYFTVRYIYIYYINKLDFNFVFILIIREFSAFKI